MASTVITTSIARIARPRHPQVAAAGGAGRHETRCDLLNGDSQQRRHAGSNAQQAEQIGSVT
jgi:hypothetical protein